MDIVSIVGRYVDLKKTGRNYVGSCPFHIETDPSFTVFPDTDSFYCFGCHRSGSGRWFLQMMGVSDLEGDYQTRKVDRKSPSVKYVNFDIVLYWHRSLRSRGYFYDRGFFDPIIDIELWGKNPENGRYTLPVWEGEPGKSNILNVRQRSVNREPRYIGIEDHNYPQLYNRHLLKDAKEVYIVFGEFDAKAMEMMGVAAVSSTNGVGSFQDEWVPLFDSAEKIYVCPDNTPSERLASSKVIAFFGGRASFRFFPASCKDANDYYLRFGNLVKFREYNEVISDQVLETWRNNFTTEGL